jgi:hypothetical protein
MARGPYGAPIRVGLESTSFVILKGIVMSDSSRRGFLVLAGAGAAAVGAATLAPGASAAVNKPEEGGPVAADGPLVAYVSDISTGEVSVMMGEREVLVHDRALCASLARALG